eukprot:6006266-Amphidinium_carterae.1
MVACSWHCQQFRLGWSVMDDDVHEYGDEDLFFIEGVLPCETPLVWLALCLKVSKRIMRL